MHNGQVGGYATLKRRLEALIPDEFYDARFGTTDSEALFLAALGFGLKDDPLGATAKMLKRVREVIDRAGTGEPLRFTSALTDGETIWAFRWATDDNAPSLYWRESREGLVVVSEPLDGEKGCWREVPQGCTLVAGPGGTEIRCMNAEIRKAA